jgi:tripartite-type tricarboxylate transporter receptor subunit TctC
MQDLVAGRIDFLFDTPVQLPFMRAGNIKAYTVTSDARLAQAPDIPTFSETGLPSVSYSGWAALFAPKNVPKEIIGKLNATAVEALADQAVRSRLADLGSEVYPRERQTPEALGALRKAEADRWWPIIKGSNRSEPVASGLGPGRVKTPARLARVEHLKAIAPRQS